MFSRRNFSFACILFSRGSLAARNFHFCIPDDFTPFTPMRFLEPREKHAFYPSLLVKYPSKCVRLTIISRRHAPRCHPHTPCLLLTSMPPCLHLAPETPSSTDPAGRRKQFNNTLPILPRVRESASRDVSDSNDEDGDNGDARGTSGSPGRRRSKDWECPFDKEEVLQIWARFAACYDPARRAAACAPLRIPRIPAEDPYLRC